MAKKKAIKGLLEDKHLQRLCAELKRPTPAFEAHHVLVTPGASGNEVEDARTLADHEALANFIMTQVRNFTTDDRRSLHASLAGGRKTMTFYMGYAMSLFGRMQDTLSHVLVSEGYEGLPGFWFPTADPEHRQLNHNGHTLDAQAAQITLAPIPFIRHRNNLPKVLLQNDNTVQFADLVQLINLGENPADIRLILDLSTQTLRIQDKKTTLNLDITPGLLELAFYAMMARATLRGENDLQRPRKSKPDPGLGQSLLEELLPICGLTNSGQRDTDLQRLQDWNTLHGKLFDRTITALEKGMSDTWFDQRCNTLKEVLREKLPDSLLRQVAPTTLWTENGQRLAAIEIDKTLKGGGYGIPLNPANITIKEA